SSCLKAGTLNCLTSTLPMSKTRRSRSQWGLDAADVVALSGIGGRGGGKCGGGRRRASSAPARVNTKQLEAVKQRLRYGAKRRTGCSGVVLSVRCWAYPLLTSHRSAVSVMP